MNNSAHGDFEFYPTIQNEKSKCNLILRWSTSTLLCCSCVSLIQVCSDPGFLQKYSIFAKRVWLDDNVEQGCVNISSGSQWAPTEHSCRFSFEDFTFLCFCWKEKKKKNNYGQIFKNCITISAVSCRRKPLWNPSGTKLWFISSAIKPLPQAAFQGGGGVKILQSVWDKSSHALYVCTCSRLPASTGKLNMNRCSCSMNKLMYFHEIAMCLIFFTAGSSILLGDELNVKCTRNILIQINNWYHKRLVLGKASSCSVFLEKYQWNPQICEADYKEEEEEEEGMKLNINVFLLQLALQWPIWAGAHLW